MIKNVNAIAYLLIGIGICLGALGAHFLETKLTADQLDSFKTGVFYQIISGIGILLVSMKENSSAPALKLIYIGCLMFSGSIYLLSCHNLLGLTSIKPVLGPITPVGGLLIISGWFLLFFRELKKK